MSITHDDLCREVEESLVDVLEGLANAKLVEHIADCDRCRDLKYEAERAIESVSHAGADFSPSAGIADRMLGLVLEARPDGPSASGPSSVSLSRTSGVVDAAQASENAMIAGAPTEFADAVDTNATMIKAPTFLVRPGEGEEHAVEEAANLAEASKDESPEGGTRTVTRMATVPGEISPSDLRSEIADPFVPSQKTIPLSAVADLRAARTKPAESMTPSTPSVPMSTVEESRIAAVEAVTGRRDTGPAGKNLITTPSASETRAEATAEDGTALPDLVPVKKAAPPGGGGSGGSVVSLFKKRGFIAALVGSMAAAAAVGGLLLHKNKDNATDPNAAFTEGAWSGTVAAITRAGDGEGGLEVCADGCKPVAQGGAIQPGSTLRTDSKTRARIKLADNSWIALDRNSEVVLPASDSREAKITRGLVVANIEAPDGAKPATLWVPQGQITTNGTKVAATVTDRRASIEVVRGWADITNKQGGSAKVRAGEEATLESTGDPVVAASATMSDVLDWSNESADDVDSPTLRGIGELRARKPGEQTELTKAVRLSSHSVKVRVVDVVARTEVDETFTNETDQELEGIFRFPLPPGAQIEKLALEVDGKLVEGAFVDRDKGAAIWRGVIQNAAPQAPKPREEIIWVPGPWRDPALLEWQRGGRFELRIFPIPKKGSRRVVLTYTEVVPQAGGIRRFTYPLAHDASGSTKIDDFNLDLQVLGNDTDFGVETQGYQLTKEAGTSGSDRFVLHEKNFVPAGDLNVEYALPNRKAALTAWAFDQPAATTQVAQNTNGAAPISGNVAVNAIRTDADRKRQAEGEAKALTDDNSPYVAFSIRPNLPRFPEGKERLHVIVVDSSRSMVGERFARATHLASSIVREMDRRDQFVVLACDVTCQAMGAQGGRSLPTPVSPSAEASQQVESFLGSIEPDGGSNLVAAVQAARASASLGSGRELRVIYLGDGTPTVGATKPATLEAAVRHVLPAGDGSVIAVALGADADTNTLTALARGAGGVLVPYVPGQRTSSAAVDVLAAAYGSVLSDVEVTLPSGVHEITPRRIDPVPAGGETFVFARMDSNNIDGNVTIRGRVGSEKFEQTFPTKVSATSAAGNAFVPRLFAAAKIQELEAAGAAEDKDRIVALSSRFQVASHHTSMIVLESEAMFKAFGLNKDGLASTFTGEERATSSSTNLEPDEDESSLDDLSKDKKESAAEEKRAGGKGRARDMGFDGDDGSSGQGFGMGGGGLSAPATKAAPSPTAAATATAKPQNAAPPPAKIATGSSATDTADPFGPTWNRPQQPPAEPAFRQPNLVPMRRVFDRKATFASDLTLATEVASQLSDAQAASNAAPDSRDRTLALYKALVASSRIGEAQELTAKWSQRDALDPDALLARADLAAANGDRERAFRILSGLADVRPGDKAVQKRLIGAFTEVGAPDLACNHRLALAEIDQKDVNNVAAAFRCTQDQGMSGVAQALMSGSPSDLRDRIDTASRSLKLADVPALLGDVRVTATWNTPADLDIALVDKNGRRFSWLGSVVNSIGVTAKDAASSSTETLAVSGLQSGTYRLEVVRASTDRGTDPIRGEVAMTLPGGEVRRIPFTVSGPRTDVGTVRVFFTSRLVPVNQFGGGGWRRSTF